MFQPPIPYMGFFFKCASFEIVFTVNSYCKCQCPFDTNAEANAIANATVDISEYEIVFSILFREWNFFIYFMLKMSAIELFTFKKQKHGILTLLISITFSSIDYPAT
jgi:hypothetical protein